MPTKTRRTPGTGRRRQRAWVRGAAFASPFLAGFAIFIAYPVFASARYSFTDFNLFQAPKSVGWANYERMLTDETFRKALFNTIFLTVTGVPLTIILALAGASILNFPVRGQPIYRAMVYLPTIVPIVVGGYLWRWLLNAQYGFVNYFLGLLHLPQPNWLLEPDWGKPAILMMSLWTIGGTIVIYLAALKDVPQELYEAAAMDGAGPFARFRYITWPTLSPVTLFQVIVTLIAYLQIFTQPYLLTQQNAVGTTSTGGPAGSMLSYSMYLFDNAFVRLKMGYASAMAWVLFLITMIITAVLLISSKKWVHYGNK